MTGVKVDLISTKIVVAIEEAVFDRWVGGFVSLGEIGG